ncbi:ABC transporter permease [Ilumatobacter sp.]|uniref:ABC transporter permease n=1 Tax=Ilumatobacter sp. TaxID=1967498 RepID=UPI003B51C2A8
MSATTPTGLPELRDAHESDRLLPYVRDVWARRGYVWYVALQELRNRQITNVLGNLWHLLNPALSIFVYYLIFGLLLKTDRGVDDFLLFLTVGLFVFQFTQKSTVDGAKSVVGNAGIVKGIKFPRAILPITSTVTELLSSLSTFALMFVILLIGGQAPRLTWLLFPAVVALQLVFNLGAAMIAARMTTHFRDTTQVLPFFFRLLLYGSGVIFSVDAYAERPDVEFLFTLNPMYCLLTIARWTTLGGALHPALIVSAVVWSLVIVTVGFTWFRAGEEDYARD